MLPNINITYAGGHIAPRDTLSTGRPAAPGVMVLGVRENKPPTHNACSRDRLAENSDIRIGKPPTHNTCVEARLAEYSGDRIIRRPTHITCGG